MSANPQGVFLDTDTLGQDTDLSLLSSLNCTGYGMTQADQVVTRAINADFIVTNKVVLTAEIIEQLPKLRLICVAATGTNNVDLAAAQARGIKVKNVTDYAGSSIAQLVFSFISQLLLHTAHYSDLVKAGAWSQSPHFCLFDKPIVELAGKTLCLIGYGALAKSVERVANAYDMKVLIAERKGATQIRPERIAFEQALQYADIISIHSPLTEHTLDLIGELEFSLMKSTAIVINTARGGIVNEAALLAALHSKQIAGAATDVLTQEPPSAAHPMLTEQPDNLLITPHIAWATVEARARVLAKVVENIQQHFEM